jgi:predicted RNase H-like nuclease
MRLPSIAIDIPIGLVQYGQQECNQLSHKKIGWARTSSVLVPSRRLVLAFSTYKAANRTKDNIVAIGVSIYFFTVLKEDIVVILIFHLYTEGIKLSLTFINHFRQTAARSLCQKSKQTACSILSRARGQAVHCLNHIISAQARLVQRRNNHISKDCRLLA